MYIQNIISFLNSLENSSNNLLSDLIRKQKALFEKNEDKIEYSFFIGKVLSNKIKKSEIDKFLNRKFQEGKFKDYISIINENGSPKIHFLRDVDFLNKVFDGFDIIRNQYSYFVSCKESVIVQIITEYEKFLYEIIESEFRNDHIDFGDKQISLNELKKMKYKKDDILDFFLEKYCNTQLSGKNKKIQNITSLLGINCDDCEDIIDEFNEIYYRRNIYVHGLRKITRDYYSLPEYVKKKWIKYGSLILNHEYLSNAFVVLNKIYLMILVKLFLYKYRDKNILEELDTEVYDNYLCLRKFSISSFVYKQLINLKWIPEVQRNYFHVNYLLSLSNNELLISELKKFDVVNKPLIFQMAKFILEKKFSKVNLLLPKIVKSKAEIDNMGDEEKLYFITIDNLENWFLFEKYRKTKYYKSFLNCYKLRKNKKH